MAVDDTGVPNHPDDFCWNLKNHEPLMLQFLLIVVLEWVKRVPKKHRASQDIWTYNWLISPNNCQANRNLPATKTAKFQRNFERIPMGSSNFRHLNGAGIFICLHLLVGGFNQPIWKICSSNWVHLPQGFGVKIKNVWNHQPVYHKNHETSTKSRY